MPVRPSMSVVERRNRIAIRHRLAPSWRTDDVAAIADGLVALHSSDPATVYLSVAARMVNPSRGPVDTALYDRRSLIRHHAMRRTLWVATPEVARIMHAAATVPIAARERNKLEQLLEANGIDNGAQWLRDATAATLAAIGERGPMTARMLGPLVPSLRTPLVMSAGAAYSATVAAHTRVLLVLGFDGEIVRTRPTGTWINGEYRWAAMSDWIPEWLPGGMAGMSNQLAAGELAARWLRAFGPAPASDLQWWTGWSGATTKAAITAAGAVEVHLDGVTGWVLADDIEPVEPPEPWVAVLPGLDPTTMGWKQRDWFLSADMASALFDRNGNGGPTIWVDGQVVGGWVQRKDGTLLPGFLAQVTKAQRRAIDAEFNRIRSTVGDTRFTVRFPAPLQIQLPADLSQA
ncbi:MAG: winged helix DNA-binding domain-containing protein [Ilumatobacteraceae bacterium]